MEAGRARATQRRHLARIQLEERAIHTVGHRAEHQLPQELTYD